MRNDAVLFEVILEPVEIPELFARQLLELEDMEGRADRALPTVETPSFVQEATATAANPADISDGPAETDDAMDFSSVLDVRPAETPLKLPGLYGGRNEAGRMELVGRFGGSLRTETAVLRALRWLKRTQRPNGSWSKTEADAMAGLGLLAFLGHGETPMSDEFGSTVLRAMIYLVGRMEGVDASKTKYLGRCYTNGICTYALSEAYGLTGIPFLKPAMEKGLGFIVEGQQPSGGFDYNYAKGARWDTSVTGWQLQALHAGHMAGADTPGLRNAIDRGVSFLRTTSYRDSRFGYCSSGDGRIGMQGVGTLCLQMLGQGTCAEVRQVSEYIPVAVKVVWDDTQTFAPYNTPVYDWYYSTQAMFHAGGDKWASWNRAFTAMVVEHQDPDGHWDSPGPGTGGRPEYDPWYATALCCLSLEVYYRYLPTYMAPREPPAHEESVLQALDRELGLGRGVEGGPPR